MAGAGAAIVCLGLVVYMALAGGGFPNGQELFAVVVYPVIVVAVEGGFCIALFRAGGRAWFRRLDGRARASTIFAAWAATVLAIVIFFQIVA
jgi:hypothetical protein